jgi:hypothetical protein
METTTDKKKLNTIDITPTWEQWMNFVMAVALRGKDPAKVLEPLSEDFKRVASGADAWNAIPTDTIDLIDDAINLFKHLNEAYVVDDSDNQVPEMVGKLEGLKEGLNKAIEIVK